ncbi:hypothetical protein E2C01_048758 [Portunus trituberculatus]|uniref:Secreted protein n=1 Tax=Portunus trituberculatus TaxID=210409 RepID=A0A5B7G3X4_PORTR|nr:hypothetical protein [Portunus trituberculatus]
MLAVLHFSFLPSAFFPLSRSCLLSSSRLHLPATAPFHPSPSAPSSSLLPHFASATGVPKRPPQYI